MAARPRKWVILIPVLVGIAAFVYLKRNEKPPVQEPVKEIPRLVRVIAVPRLSVIPEANGYGTVRPALTWEAVARVRGDIIEKHPDLEKGAILQAGTLLLRIDPTDYQLAVAEAESDIEATRAQLLELENKAANTRRSLEIEQAALELNRKELERKRSLVGKGGISRSDVEAQQRAVLAQKQSVQTQKNALNLIPSQRSLLEAQLARNQARLAQARRDLSHTEIRIPFTGRIAEVRAERDQYVREGELLVSAGGLKKAEVEAQIPLEEISNLLRSDQVVDAFTGSPEQIRRAMRLQAEVLLHEGDLEVSWPARFSRLSDTLDPKTRTVGVIVEVDDPYANVQPGVRPPLFKGLFVEVRLWGRPLPDSLVIPRLALHDGRVYLVDGDNRLQFRPVEVAIAQPAFVVVASGLEAGDRVVVSDLVPAIEGMLLAPREDDESRQRLIRQATRGKPAP
ncbi:MAG TPA: HlyD family efflux transporter periplasmic adaptor subunit [Sedimenticola sp.]|nr:HlyD family efflux transporter periplasmic adaptor subunit [Sedimenticola sp.]